MRKQAPPSPLDKVLDVQSVAQLRALRRDDSSISEVLLSCSHAAVYILENGNSIHWRKLGIEGFCYLVRRDTPPKFRLILKNQTDSGEGDFVQSLDDDIRFEVKEGTFFYQIGEHGDVRGLWFHDPEFMSKFVRTVQMIYSETQLLCDGSYGPALLNSRRESNTPNGGSAILQLLKKDTPYADVSTNNPVSPVDVRSLLRREFNSPVIQESMEGSRYNLRPPTSIESISNMKTSQKCDEMKSSIQPQFTQEDLRKILTEMVLSEQFITQLYERLVAKCRH